MVEYVVVLQPRRNTFGLGSIRFRSPLLTESISLSFPPLTEMFHFSGSCVSYPMYSGMNDRILIRSGYPIRIPPDHRLLAASRGFSQLAASFFACWHQGIHRTPLITSSYCKSLLPLPQYQKALRDLLYCLILGMHVFCVVVVVVIQLPTLLESDCFSAIVFFATQMSIFVLFPIINFLVGLTGLEPVTPRLSSACSNQLSYRPGYGSPRCRCQLLLFLAPARLCRNWWRHGDSNPGHPACKAGALPTELYPQLRFLQKKGRHARRTGSAP